MTGARLRSDEKVCEGCGCTGRKTNRGLCRDCTAKQRTIKRALTMRTIKGRLHMPPRLVDKRPERTLVCVECGCSHAYSPNFNEVPRRFCSRVCQKKASDRATTVIRKARVKNATRERFDPFEVFERDGWQCKQCGRRTPQSARGTIKDNAPELDHIMPLSQGGEHSMRNTQCLCRECNMSKSDKPSGQLNLL